MLGHFFFLYMVDEPNCDRFKFFNGWTPLGPTINCIGMTQMMPVTFVWFLFAVAEEAYEEVEA